jgi:hypothetical protein
MAFGFSSFPRLKMDAGAISGPPTLKSVKPVPLPRLRNLIGHVEWVVEKSASELSMVRA